MAAKHYNQLAEDRIQITAEANLNLLRSVAGPRCDLDMSMCHVVPAYLRSTRGLQDAGHGLDHSPC